MGVSATRTRRSQLSTELPGKGHGGIVAEGETQEYLGDCLGRPLGAPFLAPGEQLGIVPPCPTLARRAAFGAPSPLLVTRGAKLKVMMPARCPVSPLLDIQRFRKRSLSMLSAEVAGGAANGSFDAISTRASPHFTRQSKLS